MLRKAHVRAAQTGAAGQGQRIGSQSAQQGLSQEAAPSASQLLMLSRSPVAQAAAAPSPALLAAQLGPPSLQQGISNLN